MRAVESAVQEVLMRVNQPGSSNVQNSELSGAQAKKTNKTGEADAAESAKKARPADTSATSLLGGSAKTEISGKARELAKAKDVASAAPDVREDKIAELKRRIAAGAYQVDADAVADRMVDDHLRAGIG